MLSVTGGAERGADARQAKNSAVDLTGREATVWAAILFLFIYFFSVFVRVLLNFGIAPPFNPSDNE